MNGQLFQKPCVGESESLLIANLTGIDIEPGSKTFSSGGVTQHKGKITCRSDIDLQGKLIAHFAYHIVMEDGNLHSFKAAQSGDGPISKNADGTYTLNTKK